jgi:hypothetical protein
VVLIFKPFKSYEKTAEKEKNSKGGVYNKLQEALYGKVTKKRTYTVSYWIIEQEHHGVYQWY